MGNIDKGIQMFVDLLLLQLFKRFETDLNKKEKHKFEGGIVIAPILQMGKQA